VARITDLFGIDLPVIQAPLAGVQGSALAIAVCEAGALGSLPAAMLSPEQLRAELSAMSRATSAPYNVNFFCHTLPAVDAAREAAWRATLAPYYREFDIDVSTIAAGASRQPFTDEAATLLEAFRPRVVSFHFGLPSPALVARAKAWGAKVISSATTVDEARWLEQHGADAIIAQGVEAGGHRGMFLTDDLSTQLGTFALLPQVVRAVNIPVIAAGGIADADGVAAAMALGAAGVQVGTTYMLCPEATTSEVHRAALSSANAAHTALTNIFTGRPARGIVNRLMREIGPIASTAPAFPLSTSAIAPLRAKAEATGSGDFSPLWCGQNASGARAVPAGELTRALVAKLDNEHRNA
jgi:nitronate monooxygenase